MGLEHKERLLRKVKFNNDGSAEVVWRDYFLNPETGQHSHNDVTHPGTTNGETMLIHEDLKAAMAPFNEHWLIFGEEVPEVKGNHPFDGSMKRLATTTVTSVTLTNGEPVLGSDEDKKPLGVQIYGQHRLRDGRVRGYLLPPIRLGSPTEKYKFATQVDQHLQVLEEEAWLYVQGKVSPPAQTSLDLTDRVGETMDIGKGRKAIAADAEDQD